MRLLSFTNSQKKEKQKLQEKLGNKKLICGKNWNRKERVKQENLEKKGIFENKTRTELEKVKAENLEKRKEFLRVPTTREILAKEADVELLEEPSKPRGKTKKGEKGPKWRSERDKIVKETTQ